MSVLLMTKLGAISEHLRGIFLLNWKFHGWFSAFGAGKNGSQGKKLFHQSYYIYTFAWRYLNAVKDMLHEKNRCKESDH
jgi:hypothetical protein